MSAVSLARWVRVKKPAFWAATDHEEANRVAEGRILFLYQHPTSFVATDLEILRERFEVNTMECSRGSTLRGVWRRLRTADASFSWFALGFAARAVMAGKVLRRPSVVVSGGWDVIDMPEIAYGAARSRRGRRRVRLVLRGATHVLALSEWSRRAIHELSRRNSDLAYLGVDIDLFRPRATREDLVVTVGNVTRENFSRKGLETFVRAAVHMPEIPFMLVGKHFGNAADALLQIAPPNVRLTGWLPDDELRDLLSRAKVYVQCSFNEGFGLALAEAMASGCVPVVTKEGSLPEVAGEIGFYAPFGDAAATAAAIREALASGRSGAARERIASRFPLARRRDQLQTLMRNIVGR